MKFVEQLASKEFLFSFALLFVVLSFLGVIPIAALTTGSIVSISNVKYEGDIDKYLINLTTSGYDRVHVIPKEAMTFTQSSGTTIKAQKGLRMGFSATQSTCSVDLTIRQKTFPLSGGLIPPVTYYEPLGKFQEKTPVSILIESQNLLGGYDTVYSNQVTDVKNAGDLASAGGLQSLQVIDPKSNGAIIIENLGTLGGGYSCESAGNIAVFSINGKATAINKSALFDIFNGLESCTPFTFDPLAQLSFCSQNLFKLRQFLLYPEPPTGFSPNLSVSFNKLIDYLPASNTANLLVKVDGRVVDKIIVEPAKGQPSVSLSVSKSSVVQSQSGILKAKVTNLGETDSFRVEVSHEAGELSFSSLLGNTALLAKNQSSELSFQYTGFSEGIDTVCVTAFSASDPTIADKECLKVTVSAPLVINPITLQAEPAPIPVPGEEGKVLPFLPEIPGILGGGLSDKTLCEDSGKVWVEQTAQSVIPILNIPYGGTVTNYCADPLPTVLILAVVIGAITFIAVFYLGMNLFKGRKR